MVIMIFTVVKESEERIGEEEQLREGFCKR